MQVNADIRPKFLLGEGLNGVWTRDLEIPVRRSNQLSYEATDVGSWSFVGSNVPIDSFSREH